MGRPKTTTREGLPELDITPDGKMMVVNFLYWDVESAKKLRDFADQFIASKE